MNVPFSIAKKYILSKSNMGAVNAISAFTIMAIGVSTAAMLIILSIFSGLKDLHIKSFVNANPEIKISPVKGKLLENSVWVEKQLKENNSIAHYSKVVEEKVYLSYQGKEHIAYFKALEPNYNNIIPIDTAMIIGNFNHIFNGNGIVSSIGVERSLQLYLDLDSSLKMLVPKPGEGLINSEANDFNVKYATPVGIFRMNENVLNQHIIMSLKLGQSLLDLKPNECYAIEAKTINANQLNDIKSELQNALGDSYKIETREEQDAAFLKVMNIEHLMIYLLLTLIIIIASFSLAGALVIIIIDKKNQIQSLWSIGMNQNKIQTTFFITGLLIVSISMILGLIIATIVCLLQQYFGIVNAFENGISFPVILKFSNYLYVALTVFGIGSLISFLVSRRVGLIPNDS